MAATDDFAIAHRRFARLALGIYLGAAAVTIVLLVATLMSDYAHEQQALREVMLRETQTRAGYFSWYLGLLENELRRLGLRTEVNLLDDNMEPERSLLELSHHKSAFFNVGVAIVGPDGTVGWSEPRSFLAPGLSIANEPWFQSVRHSATVRVEPVQPEREADSLIYVVSPIVRAGGFSGVLLGGIDLAKEAVLGPNARPDLRIDTLLATREGAVVYPPKPPSFAAEADWQSLFTRRGVGSWLAEARLDGQQMLVATSAVDGSDFRLLSLVDRRGLFAPTRTRLLERLSLGLVVATIPLLLLIQALRRSLESFRRSEEAARREAQLRRLGEAANVIAHEITNSLNSLRVGLELVFADGAADPRKRSVTAGALRSEVQRLSDFTSELLIFSKGLTPRPVSLDLAEFLHKVVDLIRPQAAEQGVQLVLGQAETAPRVRADPKLLHVVVVNLIGNALDAAAMSTDASPRVVVEVSRRSRGVEVRVCDNGPGVAEPIRKLLFEPFVTGKPNGVGIGLALSRKIARAHGGDLERQDSEVGAAFVLRLPQEGA